MGRFLLKAALVIAGAWLMAPPVAGQDNSAARAGQALGDLLFGNPAKDQPSLRSVITGQPHYGSVYYNTLMMRLNAENAMAEAQQHKAEADSLEQLARIRNGLAQQWGRLGLPSDQAAAVAQAFTPSDSDDAVFLSVRGEPMPKIGDDIRAALGARNYQLANQLLLGALMEAQRQNAVAAPAESTGG